MATSAEPTSLRGKTALVTGASRGIGLAISIALNQNGVRVAITGRNIESLASAKKKIGKSAITLKCDARSEKEITGAIHKVKQEISGIDFLINNAGTILPIKALEAVSLQEWNKVIETNLTGLYLMTKHALPLVRDGGVIINVLSVASKQAFPNSEAYNSSKFGALGFTESLRMSMRTQKRDVRVVAVLPGAIETELWDTLWPEAPRERMLLPETVAQIIVAVLKLPHGAIVENLHIGPAGGEL